MLTGLVLESQFDPKAVSEEAAKKIAGKVFDAIFEPR